MTTRIRKLKLTVGNVGFPAIPAGTIVRVTDATNQPDWKAKRLVFIESLAVVTPEVLVSLNEGHVNP